jgi:hypothetical protein
MVGVIDNAARGMGVVANAGLTTDTAWLGVLVRGIIGRCVVTATGIGLLREI